MRKSLKNKANSLKMKKDQKIKNLQEEIENLEDDLLWEINSDRIKFLRNFLKIKKSELEVLIETAKDRKSVV